MQSTFTCTINLLKPCMFQNSKDIGCSLNSIFKPDKDLNYFDQFMQLLTHTSISEISSMP